MLCHRSHEQFTEPCSHASHARSAGDAYSSKRWLCTGNDMQLIIRIAGKEGVP